MSKISEYGNYDTGKSQTEVAKFQETGVLPVSGKYTDNGNMTTKNVKLSDLVGGGGGDAESLAGQGLYANDGKLTVVTDSTLRIVDAGYLTEPRYKVSVTNSVPTPGANHADAGKVLTVKNIDNTDEIVWDAPQGGGGGGLPDASKIIGEQTGSGGSYAMLMPYCSITLDDNGNVKTVGEIKWLWGDVFSLPDGYKDIPQ